MLLSTLHTPEFILAVAKDFFENACNAANKIPSKEQTNDIFHQIGFPATCMSFSLELALKGLLLKNKKEIFGHELDKLFYQLPEEFQDKIHNHLKTHRKFDHLINIILKINFQSESQNKINKVQQNSIEGHVREVLQSHSKSFMDFRYFYEFGKGEKTFSEKDLSFGYLGNITYSTLMILAEKCGINLPEL